MMVQSILLILLQTTSVDRLKNLKSLVEIMSEATKELIWMNQREEPEVSRDWARTDLDLVDLKLYGEVRKIVWLPEVLLVLSEALPSFPIPCLILLRWVFSFLLVRMRQTSM